MGLRRFIDRIYIRNLLRSIIIRCDITPKTPAGRNQWNFVFTVVFLGGVYIAINQKLI